MTAKRTKDVGAAFNVAAMSVAPIPHTASMRVLHPIAPILVVTTAAEHGIVAPVRLRTTGADIAPQGTTFPRTSLLNPAGTTQGGPGGPVQLHGAVGCYLGRQGFLFAFLLVHCGIFGITGQEGEESSERRKRQATNTDDNGEVHEGKGLAAYGEKVCVAPAGSCRTTSASSSPGAVPPLRSALTEHIDAARFERAGLHDSPGSVPSRVNSSGKHDSSGNDGGDGDADGEGAGLFPEIIRDVAAADNGLAFAGVAQVEEEHCNPHDVSYAASPCTRRNRVSNELGLISFWFPCWPHRPRRVFCGVEAVAPF